MIKLLEKHIEQKVVGFAKKLGYEVVKMNTLGRRAWPDRQFFSPSGVVFFIEFKRLGEQPTPLQAELHKRLRGLHQIVYVIDDADCGCRVVKGHL